MSTPLERVHEFTDLARRHGIDEVADGLTATDLHDVATELDEAIDLLAQIDAILDKPLTGTSFARLEEIRALLGNHTNRSN